MVDYSEGVDAAIFWLAMKHDLIGNLIDANGEPTERMLLVQALVDQAGYSVVAQERIRKLLVELHP